MSNTPGISPITPDVEDVRHADEDVFFGEDGSGTASEDDTDETDDEARQVVEEGRSRK